MCVFVCLCDRVGCVPFFFFSYLVFSTRLHRVHHVTLPLGLHVPHLTAPSCRSRVRKTSQRLSNWHITTVFDTLSAVTIAPQSVVLPRPPRQPRAFSPHVLLVAVFFYATRNGRSLRPSSSLSVSRGRRSKLTSSSQEYNTTRRLRKPRPRPRTSRTRWRRS